MATFYLSGSALSIVGPLYFEKSLTADNSYFSTNKTVIGALSHGLFGWGFQQTTTWMDYIKKAYININKNTNNEIESYDIGLDVQYFSNGSPAGIGQIYYTIDSFNQGNVDKVDSFVNTLLNGGANNE